MNRTQFAIVLRQAKDYRLPPEVLRDLMDAFDCRTATNHSIDGNGNLFQRKGDVIPSTIDYRAFISFAEYCPMEVTQAIVYLQKMFLQPTCLVTFARHDTLGRGTISRVDLMDALRKLGYGSLPQEHMLLLANLFETSEGNVDYGTLVQFIGEQPASINLFKLEHSIRAHLLDLIKTQGLDLLGAITAVDMKTKVRGGFGCVSDLFTALERLGCIFSSKDEETRRQFYKCLDPTGIGISLNDFVLFVEKGKVHAGKYLPSTSIAPLISVHNLRRRAGVTLSDVSHRFGDTYPLLRMFGHYDWRCKGLIGPKSFTRVLQRSGFPFINSEILALIHHFTDVGQKVAYKRFLTWAADGGEVHKMIEKKDEKGHRKQLHHRGNDDLMTPTPGSSSHNSNSNSNSNSPTVENILQSLHSALNNRGDSEWDTGWQLLNRTLESADTHCTGRLSKFQFRKCLDDLGLALTTKELKLLFLRFGNPLLYKPFIRELLNVSGFV